jgi:hypothetical protein
MTIEVIFNITEVAKLSRALDISRLVEEEQRKNSAQKSNSNTFGFNFK